MNQINNNNKIKQLENTNKQLKNNVRKLKKKNRGNKSYVVSKSNDRLPSNPLYFRGKANIINLLEEYHRITRARYLFSMIHPEVAVNQGYQVKLYSDVPVPSSSIGFKSTYQFATSSKGTFVLTWSPNFLCTAQSLARDYPDVSRPAYSSLLYNNVSSLEGMSSSDGFIYQPAYIPDIKLQKYRLVSALIKVKYNGSVLNQSGTMYSCATFDQIRVASGNLNTRAGNGAERFGDFALVRNGLWNRSVNITSDADGIECLYVPMDPTDVVFYPIGDYYGLGEDENAGSGATLCTYQKSTEGAHVNYVIAGQNLPLSASCIYVEVYANFEVIADPQAAPVIRSSIESSLSRADNNILTDLTANMTKNGALIRSSSPNQDWTSRIGDFVRKTYRIGKTIWPIVSKLFI